jgi:hypothetical protein
MSTAKYFRKLILPGLAALAVGAAVPTGATAASFVVNAGGSASGITYATQSVAASSGGGTVTIGIAPAQFQGAPVVYLNGAYAASPPDPAFTVTFTLPTGVTFTTTPAATGLGTFGACLLSGGGAGSQSATYNCPAAAGPQAAGSGAIALGLFTITGATALAVPGQAFSIRGTGSSVPIAGLNETTSLQLANAVSALQINSGGSIGPAQVIDVAAPAPLGQEWKQFGVDSLVADDGVVFISTPGNLAQASDTNAGPYSVGSTATITLTGQNWGGVTSAFLLAGAGAQPGAFTTSGCPASPPGSAITASPVGNLITFANAVLPALPSTTSNYEVCLVNSNKGLIAPNLLTSVAVPTTPGFTPTVGGTLNGLNAYNYNGEVQQVLYTGRFAAYPTYIRIVNATPNTATVATVVTPDNNNGSPGVPGSTTTTVAGSSNILIPATTLITNAGVALDATNRVSMLFLTLGAPCANNAGGVACGVSVSQFMVNPNGDVVFVGSGATP